MLLLDSQQMDLDWAWARSPVWQAVREKRLLVNIQTIQYLTLVLLLQNRERLNRCE